MTFLKNYVGSKWREINENVIIVSRIQNIILVMGCLIWAFHGNIRDTSWYDVILNLKNNIFRVFMFWL